MIDTMKGGRLKDSITIESSIAEASGQGGAVAGTHRSDEARLIPAASRELSGRLAGLSLPRQVFVLSIWPLLEQFMGFLVGTVDLAIAGRLEPQSFAVSAMDALGAATFVSWLMVLIHSASGVGAASLIARAIGGRRRGLANAAVGQVIAMAAISGAIVMAAIFVAAGRFGALCGLHGQSLELCTLYLRVMALGSPATAVLLVSCAALRAAGDTRSACGVMIIVNLANVILSVLFVFGPAPIGGHGVAGIAWGTTLAWVIGTLLILAVLRGEGGVIRLRNARLRPHWHTMRRIIKVALPNLFETACGIWLASFLILVIVGRLADSAVLGAHVIVIRVESVAFLFGFAMAMAAATLTGQYLGLGDPVRARRAVLLCWGASVVFMGLMGVLFITIPGALVSVLTSAPPLVDLAPMPIRICGFMQIPLATQIVLGSALRGAGDTRTTMWITILSTLLVRVPAAYVAAIVFDLGLNGVWIATSAEMMLRACILSARFFGGGWMKVKV